ncbi:MULTISPECIES: hypothetical protein [unclassified Specibacter]|uniref:hypothetical protein n=1 Tax=unclassified Specibacter TaxID=3081321 RepID=UPI0010522D97
MITSTWKNLVVETQFANELTLTGLRRLSAVPTDPVEAMYGSDDQNYALHVGMYSYSSGLERLCKLAIACHGYVTTGEFPELQKYSHKIGKLLDAVADLSLEGFGSSKYRSKYLVRPDGDFEKELTATVLRFAQGSGRYEHLDSLWKDKAEVKTYEEWCELAAKAKDSVSAEVHGLIALKESLANVIESEMINLELESTHESMRPDLEIQLYKPSVGVMLSLFRMVRWVSTILDVVTDSPHHDEAQSYRIMNLPTLGEVVAVSFIHSSVDFFNFQIARFSDDEVVKEELDEAYKRMGEREMDEDDDGVEVCQARGATNLDEIGSAFDFLPK